jgi:hypothetical protein
MDEATWSVCPNPFEMLNFLQTSGWGSDRKLRLVCCGLCRSVEHLLTDARYRRALDVAERFADGLADVAELRQAHAVVTQASTHTEEHEWSEDKQGMLLAANAVGWATTLREPPDPPAYLAGAAATGAKAAALTDGLPEADVHATQSALLRDILGPLPFRPVAVPPSVRACDNGAVVRLAEAIYAERGFGDLPILADALDEASCTDQAILAHLRGPGPHVRGCWAVDLVLAKE